MTTIVYKDGVLACDSRATSNDTIVSEHAKKLYVFDHDLFKILGDPIRALAVSGRLGSVEPYIRFVTGKQDSFNFEDFDLFGVAVGNKAVYDIEDFRDRILVHSFKDFVTRGSGSLHALTLSKTKMSAVEIVKYTAQFNVATNRRIQSWSRK